jgi:competence protein ComEC
VRGVADLQLLGPAVCCWVGAWLTPGPGWWLPVLLLGVVLRWRRAAVAACLVCALGGVLGASLRVQARGSGPLPGWASAHSSAVIEAVLSDDPRLVVSRKGTPLTLLTVTSQSVTVKGARLRQRVPLLVLAQGGGWLGLLPSTRVTFSARLVAARPGDEVAALAFPEHRAPRVRAGPSRLQRAAGRLRWGLREASTGLPVGADGLLPGLVVGDTAGLRPSDKAAFRNTGLTHIMLYILHGKSVRDLLPDFSGRDGGAARGGAPGERLP